MTGLAVTRLTLSHFRSHLRTELSVDERPLAFCGPNGAGKTNILEAVSLLSPGRGLRRASAEEMIRQPESIGWKVVAQVTVPTQVHEIETAAEPGQARQVRIDGKAEPKIALGRIVRVIWLTPPMDRLWIEGAGGRRRFLDRMTMSLEPGHGEAVLGYERAMRERNRLLKDNVRDPHWYVALERQMAETGARIIANRRAAVSRIAAAQDGAGTAFPVAELSLGHPGGELPEGSTDLADVLNRGRHADLAAGRTLRGPHRADMTATYAEKGVSAAQCSTGEQKALLISIVLANARALSEDTGSPPIILLDEVAAHLDSDRRAALFAEILRLGGQAWMTGTGPELLEDLGDRVRIFHVAARNGRSEVSP
ncbi:MAG: DNA replication/repair protein RecF [Boseongicola sp. SB0677_bin_26]|nr:DNA replication/repair protein RecF [Boseongicola sp. SB0665_bin_10]MYG27956.1 DNA replication/repair protein RecF [Boseongicola sp. SB0677_bin_26]